MDNERHKILCKVPNCWYCGDELDEPKEYATCDDHCWTLLMHSNNAAWCDGQATEDLITLAAKLKD